MAPYVVRLEDNPDLWDWTGPAKYGAMVHTSTCSLYVSRSGYSKWLTGFNTPEAARDEARERVQEPVWCCKRCMQRGCAGCHHACRRVRP